MISLWTQHIKDTEERSRFESGLKGSKYILDRLKDILEQDLKSLANSEESVKAFDQPNWDYKQARTNGCKYTIKNIIKLIDLDQQKETTLNGRDPIG